MDPITPPLGSPILTPLSMLELVIVGRGRLGLTVASALTAAGHHVTTVGRGETIPTAPIVWLTVPDREIAAAAAAVPPGPIVLHASGATDLSPLRPHPIVGSLHPLMSFPGLEIASPPMAGVPAAIAGDPLAREAAIHIASALGWRPFEVPGDRRLYHAAAVMAGNFAIALLAEAAIVLVAAGVPAADASAMLAPLALASLANLAALGPAAALTGPVARGDEGVIAQHRDALSELDPRLLRTYDAMLDATRSVCAPGHRSNSGNLREDDTRRPVGSSKDTPDSQE